MPDAAKGYVENLFDLEEDKTTEMANEVEEEEETKTATMQDPAAVPKTRFGGEKGRILFYNEDNIKLNEKRGYISKKRPSVISAYQVQIYIYIIYRNDFSSYLRRNSNILRVTLITKCVVA